MVKGEKERWERREGREGREHAFSILMSALKAVDSWGKGERKRERQDSGEELLISTMSRLP